MTEPHEHPDAHPPAPEDDEWFVHTPDEPDHQKVHGRINEGGVGAVLIIVMISVFVVAGLLVGYVPRAVNALKVDRQERNPAYYQEYRELEARWEQRLNPESWQWADEEAGTVRIPADLAKELVMEEYRNAR